VEIGARYIKEGKCIFSLWAPFLRSVSVKIISPQARAFPLQKTASGYWRAAIEDIAPGSAYYFVLDDSKELPDPASFFQPQGVHGPSQVIDQSSFAWQDQKWSGIPLDKLIIYEIHVGSFTPEGNFAAIIPRLKELANLGVNAIEIMPVAQFPGERNWGYDGAYPFAVQNSYGGPSGLKNLINQAHAQGLAVILDVVYNHLGPEGNYLAEYAPYFTDKYHTPWGKAVNFDDTDNQGVRNYFIQNALYWFKSYHVDALRIDAIHGIFDKSPKHILKELAEEVEKFSAEEGRRFYLIVESDLNQAQVIRERSRGGYGIDAQWCDDFHHCLHTLLTGEKNGYYADFGKIEQLEKSFREGFVYTGEYSVYRKSTHGTSSRDIPADRFVVFLQNHDQVGNRLKGERLSTLVNFEGLKLAIGSVLLSPYIPLLFMGEEYGEEAPFLYFVSHSDPALAKAVWEGRKKEFEAFGWRGELPDPACEETFLKTKIDWSKREEGKHKVLLNFYKELISLRKNIPALNHLDKDGAQVVSSEEAHYLYLRRWYNDSDVVCLMNFSQQVNEFKIDLPGDKWRKIIDSAEEEWLGPGSALPQKLAWAQKLKMRPLGLALYEKAH